MTCGFCFFLHHSSDSSFLGKTSQIHLFSGRKHACVHVVTRHVGLVLNPPLHGLGGSPGRGKGTWVCSLILCLLGHVPALQLYSSVPSLQMEDNVCTSQNSEENHVTSGIIKDHAPHVLCFIVAGY